MVNELLKDADIVVRSGEYDEVLEKLFRQRHEQFVKKFHQYGETCRKRPILGVRTTAIPRDRISLPTVGEGKLSDFFPPLSGTRNDPLRGTPTPFKAGQGNSESTPILGGIRYGKIFGEHQGGHKNVTLFEIHRNGIIENNCFYAPDPRGEECANRVYLGWIILEVARILCCKNSWCKETNYLLELEIAIEGGAFNLLLSEPSYYSGILKESQRFPVYRLDKGVQLQSFITYLERDISNSAGMCIPSNCYMQIPAFSS